MSLNTVDLDASSPLYSLNIVVSACSMMFPSGKKRPSIVGSRRCAGMPSTAYMIGERKDVEGVEQDERRSKQ